MADRPPAGPAIDDPAVLAEVSAAFQAYDAALLTHDLDALDEWFWTAPETVRFGIGEELHGAAQIAAYRRAQPQPPTRGPVLRQQITTFGAHAASVAIEFDQPDGGRGRQSQCWIRLAEGWRVVAAHVSERSR